MSAGLSTEKPLQDRLPRIFTCPDYQKARQQATNDRVKEERFRLGLQILLPRSKFPFSHQILDLRLQAQMTTIAVKSLLKDYVEGHPNLLEKAKRIIEDEEAKIAKAEMEADIEAGKEAGKEAERRESVRMGYGGW